MKKDIWYPFQKGETRLFFLDGPWTHAYHFCDHEKKMYPHIEGGNCAACKFLKVSRPYRRLVVSAWIEKIDQVRLMSIPRPLHQKLVYDPEVNIEKQLISVVKDIKSMPPSYVVTSIEFPSEWRDRLFELGKLFLQEHDVKKILSPSDEMLDYYDELPVLTKSW